MMYATTRDFYTFSEPKVWVDRGYSVIDSTMIKHDGTYYRFTKDERNNTSSTPSSKFIFEEKCDSILNLYWTAVAEGIGKGAMNAAEGPLVFKSNTEDKWYAVPRRVRRPRLHPVRDDRPRLRRPGPRRPATTCRPSPATAPCCRSPRPSTTGCCAPTSRTSSWQTSRTCR